MWKGWGLMAKNLLSWFQKGMSFKEYVDSMKVNQEQLKHIYDTLHISEEDQAFFRQLKEKKWNAVVLTADWCGDAMLCVPIIQRLAELAEMELRFLIRDENLELMDQYLTNGKSRSIPIFIFIDETGNEQAVWGPRAPEVQALVEEMRRKLPDKEDPTFEEKQNEMYRQFRNQISTDKQIWQYVITSVRERLAQAI